jgi:hypothetical protein
MRSAFGKFASPLSLVHHDVQKPDGWAVFVEASGEKRWKVKSND